MRDVLLDYLRLMRRVAAGPLVRSSYHADQNLPEGRRAESLLAS